MKEEEEIEADRVNLSEQYNEIREKGDAPGKMTAASSFKPIMSKDLLNLYRT